MAGTPIRSAHLNKMEFVKWKEATVARRLQIWAIDRPQSQTPNLWKSLEGKHLIC